MARAGLAELLTLLIVACAPMCGASEAATCKLPEADVREGASAPTLDGAIAQKRGLCFQVTPRRQTQEGPRVCVARDTRIFTVYGGLVKPSELRDQQWVHVWLKGCRPPRPESASEAAVIEVASLKPGEDFP